MRDNWPFPEKKELNENRNLGVIRQFLDSALRRPWIFISSLFLIFATGWGIYFYSKFAETNTKPETKLTNATNKPLKNKRPKTSSLKSNSKSPKPSKNVSQKVVQVKKEPIVVSTVTNSSSAVIQDLIMPDGKTKRTIKPPRQVWDNAANQLIAFAISMKEGADAAPLPSGVSDAEFIRAMKRDIVIFDDDTKEVKELKRSVREVRKDILKMMVETGKGFEEILNEHRDMVNSNTQFYREALKGASEVAESGTAEDVDEYIERANELLKQRGEKTLSPRSAHGRRRGRK